MMTYIKEIIFNQFFISILTNVIAFLIHLLQ